MVDQGEGQQAEWAFDVFVSYSHSDRGWVHNWLVPRLRSKGLNVCLDEDSFEPGLLALQNMQNAVLASRHTLLVLTPDYVTSQWATFEWIQARQRDPLGLARRTLPVLAKPCKIPESIADLTYIDLTDLTIQERQLARLIAAILGQPFPQPGSWRESGQAPSGPTDMTTSGGLGAERPAGVGYGATTRAAPAKPTMVVATPPALVGAAQVGEAGRRAAQENADAFGRGLSAIREGLRNPEVREIVGEFKADLAAACEQISILGDYKDIHDQLHDLEIGWFDTFVDDSQMIIHDDRQRKRLRSHARDLQVFVEELKEITSRGHISSEDAGIVDLAEASELLLRVGEIFDADQLNDVVDLIRNVLQQRPSIINTSLVNTARSLRLSALIEAMSRVSCSLEYSDLIAEKSHFVIDGIEALSRLVTDLNGQISAHDMWQQVDNEMRPIDPIYDGSIRRVERRWPKLKRLAEPLYLGSTEPWALELVEKGQMLDRAIEARDPEGIRDTFQEYRYRAARRFYHVDKALKQRCGYLREGGKELAALLRGLG